MDLGQLRVTYRVSKDDDTLHIDNFMVRAQLFVYIYSLLFSILYIQIHYLFDILYSVFGLLSMGLCRFTVFYYTNTNTCTATVVSFIL